MGNGVGESMIQSLLRYEIGLHLINCDLDTHTILSQNTPLKIDTLLPVLGNQNANTLDIIIITNPTDEQIQHSTSLLPNLSKVILIYTSDTDAIRQKKSITPPIHTILSLPLDPQHLIQVINQSLVHLYTHNEYLSLTPKPIIEELGKVLIVDDESELTNNLSELLSPYFRIYKAYSGQEAISLIEKIPNLNIVLLDLHLPDYAADHLCDAIYAISRNIKLICMSGNPNLSQLLNPKSINAIEAFIAKPFIYQELVHLLKTSSAHLNRQQSINLATLTGLSSHQEMIQLFRESQYNSI